MTHALPVSLADESGKELLHELAMDYVFKGLIVVVAILILAAAMALIWKKFGRNQH
jgi:hypothetical protein